MKLKNLTINKNNLLIYSIVIMLIILVFKTLISTYLSAVITLIPSIFVFFLFCWMFFRGKIKLKCCDIFMGIIFLVGTISGLLYHQPIIAILYQIKSLGIYYLLFMIIRNIDFDDKQKKKMLNMINIITIVLIIFSFVEVMFKKDFLFPSSWAKDIVYADNFIRAYSFICNPNVFAFYLIFVLFYNYRFGNVNNTFKSVGFNSLIFTGIIISVSRSGYLAIAFVILFWLIMQFVLKKDKKIFLRYLKVFFLSLVTCAFLTFSIYECNKLYTKYLEFNGIYGENDGDDSNNQVSVIDRVTAVTEENFFQNSLSNGRIAIVMFGLERWNKSPMIGTGFSSFLSASSFLNEDKEASEKGLEYADNQFITILVETGVIGFASLGIAYFLIVIDQIRKKQYTALVASLVFAFFGLFINVLEVQVIAFLYFLFIGLTYKTMPVENSKLKKVKIKISR